jgi:A/G-specific adenine glycosylase
MKKRQPAPSERASAASDAAPGRVPSPLVLHTLRQDLLAWFRRGHRDLPWRKTQNPYAIWISEVMLQQTRTETVKGYFERFMRQFPTVTDLANAPLDDVLSLWSGLGYYSRARNLHKAAQHLRDLHGGQFPTDPSDIEQLPGIGPYTAGAIRSIAFSQAAPIVDGNVVRVFSRLFALDERLDSPAGKTLYWTLARALLPNAAPPGTPPKTQNDPGDTNQALMELGATVCLPKRPVCLSCPVATLCQAHKEGRETDFPPEKPPRQVPTVQNVTLLLVCADEVLLVRRPEVGLWGGLWEPPTLPLQDGETATEGLARLCKTRLGLQKVAEQTTALPAFSHVLTHRKMVFQPFVLTYTVPPRLKPDGYTGHRFVPLHEPLGLGLSAWTTSLLARVSDAGQPSLF